MSSESDYYSTASRVSAESKVKGSRFIAHAAPVESRETAEKFVAEISHKFRDATHNCFAFKIGVGDQANFRFSDAAEPSGTAGRPILQAIESRNLTNVVVVVTRYFGGTKLGTGGLIRAYNGAALAALDQANVVRYFPQVMLRLRFDYGLSNLVHQVIDKFAGSIRESHFDQRMTHRVSIKAADEQAVKQALKDVSSGRIQISRDEHDS